MNEFDENKAIAVMRAALPDDAPKYDDDQLLNVIDMIWDYYEENGMLNVDLDDEESDEDEDILSDLTDYVTRMLRKDRHASVLPEHVAALVAAELQYEDSLMDF